MEHFLQHPWYYFKEYQIMQLISGILSVVLTGFAMWWIDKKAAKRWTQEGYLKRKIELEIEMRKDLIWLNELFIKYSNSSDSENIEHSPSDVNAIQDRIHQEKLKNRLNLLIKEYNLITNNELGIKNFEDIFESFIKPKEGNQPPTENERKQKAIDLNNLKKATDLLIDILQKEMKK